MESNSDWFIIKYDFIDGVRAFGDGGKEKKELHDRRMKLISDCIEDNIMTMLSESCSWAGDGMNCVVPVVDTAGPGSGIRNMFDSANKIFSCMIKKLQTKVFNGLDIRLAFAYGTAEEAEPGSKNWRGHGLNLAGRLFKLHERDRGLKTTKTAGFGFKNKAILSCLKINKNSRIFKHYYVNVSKAGHEADMRISFLRNLPQIQSDLLRTVPGEYIAGFLVTKDKSNKKYLDNQYVINIEDTECIDVLKICSGLFRDYNIPYLEHLSYGYVSAQPRLLTICRRDGEVCLDAFPVLLTYAGHSSSGSIQLKRNTGKIFKFTTTQNITGKQFSINIITDNAIEVIPEYSDLFPSILKAHVHEGNWTDYPKIVCRITNQE